MNLKRPKSDEASSLPSFKVSTGRFAYNLQFNIETVGTVDGLRYYTQVTTEHPMPEIQTADAQSCQVWYHGNYSSWGWTLATLVEKARWMRLETRISGGWTADFWAREAKDGPDVIGFSAFYSPSQPIDGWPVVSGVYEALWQTLTE